MKAPKTIVLISLLSLAPSTQALAVNFSGSLNGVSITDAQGGNQAPIAAFTYTQDGDSIIFDASGSSDPDGSVAKYKWDFGDGTFAEGVTATYTLTGTTKVQVTLTVIDNNNGVAINQQTITPTTKGVADDFSVDSSGNYTILSGGLDFSEGVARANGAWKTTYAIHNKELASSDHMVEADVYTNGANAAGGLMFRVNKLQETGYMVAFSNGAVTLSSYSAGSKKWMANFKGNFSAGPNKLRAQVSGNIIKIFTNGELVLERTDNTYTTGNAVGLYIEPYGDITSVTVDNLIGK